MGLKVIGRSKDLRINTDVVYALIDIQDYLKLVGDDFDKFDIQRNREKHPSYERLKEDIKNGASLPGITLALKANFAQDLQEKMPNMSDDELSEYLANPNQVHILDGLQRTYIIHDINSGFKDGQQLLLEFWIEKHSNQLIYRFIVLNAGRKAMTLNHQLELLFMTMRDTLQEEMQGLEIFIEKADKKRDKPKMYAFNTLVSTYYCFITKNYETDKKNWVARQMLEDKVIFTTEDTLKSEFQRFKEYLAIYMQIDERLYSRYEKQDKNWLATDAFMNAFFAAAAASASGNGDVSKQASVKSIMEQMASLCLEKEVFALNTYKEIKVDESRYNVGAKTRKLIFQVVKDYFRDKGATSFEDLWAQDVD
jgi:hypothetical protein